MKKRQKPKQWFGCYQDSWKGHITAASYAHPAKFAKGLVERILDYMAEQGWIAKGDAIGDPFGGVGTGGIVAAYRGYQWIGVELEPKFVALAVGNFALHASRFARLGVPEPIIACGDSRAFNQIEGGNRNGRGQTRARKCDCRKSDAWRCAVDQNLTGQVSCHCECHRQLVDSVVSSPPYAGSLDDGGPEKQHPDGYERQNNWTGYGKAPGQIATLKSGDVDAIVGSPPFLGCRSDTTSSGGGINKRGYEGKEPARPSHKNVGKRSYQAGQNKPRDPANIEVLMPGTMAAVVTSPPYADSVNSSSHGIDFGKAKKDYPGRVKKRIPLCSDTMRLLVWLGFEEVERIHAMLTEEQIHHDLFEGTTTRKKERKSFFRRIYEKNMAPGDPRRIDFEEVLVVRKPLA